MHKIYAMAILCLFFSTVSISQSLSDSLLVYLKFNGNLADSSGNGNDALANGQPGSTSDRAGNQNSALLLDGNGFAQIPHVTAFSDMNDGFTITAWINPYSMDTYDVIISKFDVQGNTRELVFRMHDNGAVHNHFNSNGIIQYCTSSEGDLTLDTWQQVALVWNGSFVKQYVNGTLVRDCPEIGESMALDNGDFNIGVLTPSGQEDFNGAMDDIRIYDVAFSDIEIRSLYNEEDIVSGLFDNSAGVSYASIYPNPAQTFISIESEKSIEKLEIVDVEGKILIRESEIAADKNVSINSLETGIYFVHMLYADGNFEVKKIIKQD